MLRVEHERTRALQCRNKARSCLSERLRGKMLKPRSIWKMGSVEFVAGTRVFVHGECGNTNIAKGIVSCTDTPKLFENGSQRIAFPHHVIHDE